MWKANGKTTILQLFLDSLSPKTEKLSLEGTMDLSRDRLILELDVYHGNSAHLNGVPHKPLPSVCVSACESFLSLQGNGSVKGIPSFGARQRLGKHVSTAMNTRNNRKLIVGRVIFYAVRVFIKGVGWSVCVSAFRC
jgi:hypothetical protein